MPGHRQPSGLAFAIRDPLPWNDLVGIVRAAENAGYRALFLPEISGRDALVTLGALARDTRDLLLGTGVLPMRSRTPLLTAMGSATVDKRSGGRLLLGLGPGPGRPGRAGRARGTHRHAPVPRGRDDRTPGPPGGPVAASECRNPHRADLVVVYPIPVGEPAASIEATLLALAP